MVLGLPAVAFRAQIPGTRREFAEPEIDLDEFRTHDMYVHGCRWLWPLILFPSSLLMLSQLAVFLVKPLNRTSLLESVKHGYLDYSEVSKHFDLLQSHGYCFGLLFRGCQFSVLLESVTGIMAVSSRINPEPIYVLG